MKVKLCIILSLLLILNLFSTGFASNSAKSFQSSTTAQVVAKTLPIKGNFSLSFYPDILMGQTMCYEGIFTKQLKGVYIICENKGNNQKNTLVSNVTVKANTSILIDIKHGWGWQPGDLLTIKAYGYADFKYQLPTLSDPKWDKFVFQNIENLKAKMAKTGKIYSYMDPTGVFHTMLGSTDISAPSQSNNAFDGVQVDPNQFMKQWASDPNNPMNNPAAAKQFMDNYNNSSKAGSSQTPQASSGQSATSNAAKAEYYRFKVTQDQEQLDFAKDQLQLALGNKPGFPAMGSVISTQRMVDTATRILQMDQASLAQYEK